MVAVKSDCEDYGLEKDNCHQPYSDEGEEGDENAGTFQIIISVHTFCVSYVSYR